MRELAHHASIFGLVFHRILDFTRGGISIRPLLAHIEYSDLIMIIITIKSGNELNRNKYESIKF